MLLYRVIITLLWGPAALGLLLQVLRGQETFGDWLERLGLRMGRVAGSHVWIHAASNGELASAKPLVLALCAARPDLKLLITTNSVSGRSLARKWQLSGVTAQLAPIDTFWAARGLKNRFGIVGLMILESEFWLNRIAVMARNQAPVFVMGARLSKSTARSWARFGLLTQALQTRLSYLSPQDRRSRQRFLALGFPQKKLGPLLDLKSHYLPPDNMTPEGDLTEVFARDATWLAASTHAEEDEIVLRAHRLLKESWPDLQLILAPRHPRRGDAIADLIRERGFDLARRSADEPPRKDAVYLVDTLGEMPLWYQLAGTSFIGGSLVDAGGHTPFEPAAFDSTILHGPFVRNFADTYRQLDHGGSALRVRNAQELCNAVLATRDPKRQEIMRHRARQIMHSSTDIRSELDRFLKQLPE